MTIQDDIETVRRELSRTWRTNNTVGAALLRIEEALAAPSSGGRRITQVEAATLTDAMRYPENGANYCRYCGMKATEPHYPHCWYLGQVARVDAARKLVDALSAPPSPEQTEERGGK